MTELLLLRFGLGFLGFESERETTELLGLKKEGEDLKLNALKVELITKEPMAYELSLHWNI